jgi:hypothetical protein
MVTEKEAAWTNLGVFLKGRFFCPCRESDSGRSIPLPSHHTDWGKYEHPCFEYIQVLRNYGWKLWRLLGAFAASSRNLDRVGMILSQQPPVHQDRTVPLTFNPLDTSYRLRGDWTSVSEIKSHSQLITFLLTVVDTESKMTSETSWSL